MFDIESVEVSFLDEKRKAVWQFAGRSMKGDEYLYAVDDHNYEQRNHWEFVVQVPDAWTKGNSIIVRPRSVPNRRVWAGLERKALCYQRATIGKHNGKVYSKLPISDVTGQKTKIMVTRDNRKAMPAWLRAFDPVMKMRVASSRGNDGEHLVAVLKRDDHVGMIRLFVALKPWVLADDYDPAEARKAALRRSLKERQVGIRKSLRGKVVAVTGGFGYGTRDKVWRLLERMGAKINTHPTSRADLLLVGAHYLGDGRLKVQEARNNGVAMLTEAAFRRKYSI